MCTLLFQQLSVGGKAISGIGSSTDEDITEFRARFDELRARLTIEGVLSVQRDVQVILGSMGNIGDTETHFVDHSY